MSEFAYFYHAAWGGELPNTQLDVLTFDRDLEAAKAFAQAKSVETGWAEVVTIYAGLNAASDLPVGVIVYERGRQMCAEGLMG